MKTDVNNYIPSNDVSSLISGVTAKYNHNCMTSI